MKAEYSDAQNIVDDVLSIFDETRNNGENSACLNQIGESKRVTAFNSPLRLSPNSATHKKGVNFSSLPYKKRFLDIQNKDASDSMSLGSQHTQTIVEKKIKSDKRSTKELKNALGVLKTFNIKMNTEKLELLLQSLSEDNQEHSIDDIYNSYQDDFYFDKKNFYRLLYNDR